MSAYDSASSDFQVAIGQSADNRLQPGLNRFPDTSFQSLSRHERFYFPDGNVKFLVESILYNVHRYFFENYSAIFASMFSLPPPAGMSVEGLTEHNPIVLEGVEARDFDQLLSIFYPTGFEDDDPKTLEEWTSVLELATRWEFTSLRMRAINRLFLISTPIDKIVLGHAYDLPIWLHPAYADVCQRDDPLTIEEGRRLGVDDTILISMARHRLYSSGCRHHRSVIESTVANVFPPSLPRASAPRIRSTSRTASSLRSY